MSFLSSIKSAFGGNGSEEYDFDRPTAFVNPFSKDNNVPEHHEAEETAQLDQHAEYAIDAEFADKAARLMNQHTQAVIDMIKVSWKKEREALLKQVEDAKKSVEDSKEKMQVNESKNRQAQTRANDLSAKMAELQANYEKLDLEKKSLQSRINAMEARGKGADDLTKKVGELTATVETLKKQGVDKDAQIKKLGEELKASGADKLEELNKQIKQREDIIEQLRANNSEMQERLEAADEGLKAVDDMQKAIDEIAEFKEKKNAEIASLRKQVEDYQNRLSEYDEMRKSHIVLTDENDKLKKTIDHLEATAKQNAEVQNRRNVDTGNLIDGLKQQLSNAKAMAEDFKSKFVALSSDGEAQSANVAKLSNERDEAKAELKRTQVNLQKKQHEVQAMNDAINEKDRRIASLLAQIDELQNARPVAADEPKVDVPLPTGNASLEGIDDIDWADGDDMPPHPGEDPRQLSLF